ncbi:MAG: Coproheme decarboxylase HemQ (no EC), partial [uncultured Blastococcus sp.]
DRRAQHRQAGERAQRQHPVHDVVGVPAGQAARGRGAPARRRRGRRPVRGARRQGRRRPRDVRRRRAAGRCRSHGLVARRVARRPAGGLHPAAPHHAGPPPRPGVVADGAAPAGGVQPQPHPGLPRRRGAAPLPVRLPVRAVLRVVPAARRGAAGHAQGARHAGPRLPRRAGQHRGGVRPGRLRVDARLRGRGAAPDRRPHARAAGQPGTPARPRGGAVLHRHAQVRRRAGGRPRL